MHAFPAGSPPVLQQARLLMSGRGRWERPRQPLNVLLVAPGLAPALPAPPLLPWVGPAQPHGDFSLRTSELCHQRIDRREGPRSPHGSQSVNTSACCRGRSLLKTPYFSPP